MWTISKVLAMAVLTGLSMMDYRIRKVPRDVLLLCMAGVIIYQVLTGNVDWKLSVAGGLSGILFLWISKITNEAIGYGDSLAILISVCFVVLIFLFYTFRYHRFFIYFYFTAKKTTLQCICMKYCASARMRKHRESAQKQ